MPSAMPSAASSDSFITFFSMMVRARGVQRLQYWEQRSISWRPNVLPLSRERQLRSREEV
jgi:hypothetical protein